MTDKSFEQEVEDMMGAPLIQQILKQVGSDKVGKIQEGVRAALREVVKAREEGLVRDWEAANVGKDNDTSSAVWGKDSEADLAAIAEEKKYFGEMSELFYKLQAVATPGETHIIFEENAWAGFDEVVRALRRHNIPLPKIT